MGRGNSKLNKNNNAVHKFSSIPAWDFAYEHDGGETVAFFRENSNFDELISAMDYDERDAFRSWASGHFMNGQQYEGFDAMSAADKKRTRIYDKYLDQSVLNEGIEVARLSTAELVLGKGNKAGDLSELRKMEGRIITSKGNLSTGAAAQGLGIGDRRKDVEYHISIPKGAKGAGMWIGDIRVNGWGPDQREFMINRDTAFRVGKSTYNASRKVFEVNLEFVGLLEHDYGNGR